MASVLQFMKDKWDYAVHIAYLEAEKDCEVLVRQIAKIEKVFSAIISFMASVLQFIKDNWDYAVDQETESVQNAFDSGRILHIDYLKAQEKCEMLVQEIDEIKKVFSKIISFIRSKKDLSDLCDKTFAENKQFIAFCNPPNTNHLDPQNNIFDRLCLLRLQKNEQEHYLRECKIFIKANKDVYDCFEKYINAESNPYLKKTILEK